MRKICLVSSLLIFLLSFSVSFAEEVSPTPSPKVNYELPYPGLLPDSPLYFLRIIRDRTVGFLISDPLKKSQFHLLQADKRLNAGIYLFNKGKVSMGISTISKAENYFHKAISEIRKFNGGINTRSLTEKLLDSSRKHQEVIKSLEEKSKGNARENLKIERERVVDFEKQVERLIKK